MEPARSLDPTFWYVVNHRYKHLVYRSKDRAKAKAYALARNKSPLDESEYAVVSGSQLKVQGLEFGVKSPAVN
ncbi:hypothetical protein [Halioxenophilus sp. WMMB6]|uniref:hypothetical protein n=1 Tax=Halioxenophilus sp. WMMB6 TaxID=3073815 RepID=UPI00295F4167|nr:hypothetical protein [Halioxenophilus sp. WMMB6]